MARLRIAPIVEGNGEMACIHALLGNVWRKFVDAESPEILKPIKKNRTQLDKRDKLRRFVEEAATFLAGRSTPSLPGLILILLDADDDCPAELGPRLRGWAKDVDARFEVACVVANLEYETWFVAAAESLAAAGFLGRKGRESFPDDPEGQRLRKGWIEERYRIAKGEKYDPVVHQLPMTQAMDLDACHERSASFRKLCRELTRFAIPSV